MEDKTKTLIVLGGVGVAAYFLFRPSEETAGFGGGGGIPLISSPLEESVDEASTIVYNIPPMPAPEWAFAPTMDGVVPVSKKATYAPTIAPSYPLEYYTKGGLSELSAAATPTQKLKSVMELQYYGDPFAYLFSGRTDKLESKKDKTLKPDIHQALSVKGHQVATKQFDPSKYGKTTTGREWSGGVSSVGGVTKKSFSSVTNRFSSRAVVTKRVAPKKRKISAGSPD